VRLQNQTFFERNIAQSNVGGTIHLDPAASMTYTLPAPPGRWLSVRQGTSFELTPGAVNSDFPYACPAGVVGGPTPEEQSGPQCSRPWCAFEQVHAAPRRCCLFTPRVSVPHRVVL
jgi:hypothetical protein